MKTNIQIFNSPEFGEIRTMTMPDGQIGFVGKDVATALGYAKPRNAIATHVEEDDKTTALIQGPGFSVTMCVKKPNKKRCIYM